LHARAVEDDVHALPFAQLSTARHHIVGRGVEDDVGAELFGESFALRGDFGDDDAAWTARFEG